MASQYDIPWHMLKGLDPTNSEFCTLKGSVTTGMEPSARDEIAVKLRSVAYCARGRVFFDVKIDQVHEAFKLRSLDHVLVLIAVEPKFGFVKNKVICLRRLRLLPRQLDWKKALSVWQRQSGFKGEPHTRRPDDELEVIELTMPSEGGDAAAAAPATGDPLRDMLHSLQQPVKGTCPEGAAETEEGKGEPAPELLLNAEGEGTKETTAAAAGDGQTTSDAAGAEMQTTADVAADVTADVTADATADAAKSDLPAEAATVEAGNADTQPTSVVTDAPAEDPCPTAETAQAGEKQVQAEEAQTAEAPAGEAQAAEAQAAEAQAKETQTQTEVAASVSEETGEVVADVGPEKAGDTPADAVPTEGDGAAAASAQVAPPATAASEREGVMAFRATCFRAGGGKQGHAFSSNEGAENFGGAVQDLFDWKVQMKGFDLEVILDVAYDMVIVGLSLTPRALFYRNLVKMGPTSLRSTVCFNLLMMAKPQPYEIIVDPMCGGGSISLEGAQAFPGTFHLCGDNYPDAAPRVALNREFSSRQVSDTANLAVDVFTWDCTRLPLRDGCADVIVSDLPFGKRMGSKFDNRTLYPACMEEMGRICTPRYGRAVLLTQDKRTMEKTLHSHRVKSLWRCRASPYINIGGLDGCAYLLQRTDFVRRPRPPPSRPAAAPTAASTDAPTGAPTGAQLGQSPAKDASVTVKTAAAAAPGATEAQSPASDVPLTGAEKSPGSQVAGNDAPPAAEDVAVPEPVAEPAGKTSAGMERSTTDVQGSEVTHPESSAPEAATAEASAAEPLPTSEVAAVPEVTVTEVSLTEATASNEIPEVASPDAKVPEDVSIDAKVPEEVSTDAKTTATPAPDAKVSEASVPDAKSPE